jgi:hypothetical protein
MQKVIKEEDGTRWIADTKTDICLYQAPRNPPNTGQEYTRGTDLYAHKTRSHGQRFYYYIWSMWQGEEPSIRVVSRDEAQEFLEECVGDYYGFPNEEDVAKLKEWGFDILAETA